MLVGDSTIVVNLSESPVSGQKIRQLGEFQSNYVVNTTLRDVGESNIDPKAAGGP